MPSSRWTRGKVPRTNAKAPAPKPGRQKRRRQSPTARPAAEAPHGREAGDDELARTQEALERANERFEDITRLVSDWVWET